MIKLPDTSTEKGQHEASEMLQSMAGIPTGIPPINIYDELDADMFSYSIDRIIKIVLDKILELANEAGMLDGLQQ